MLKFELDKPKDKDLNILCLGAHSDDIEIGCGGTILKLLSEYSHARVHWIVFSATKKRSEEAKVSAKHFLAKASQKKIEIKKFRESFFPYIGAEIKETFEKLKQKVSPDIIFTHYRHDLHQDHRLVCELTWNTFRDNLILEYEVIKYDGHLSKPNCYFWLNEEICKNKISYIMNFFKSQNKRSWFSEESFSSILRLRGIESNSPGGYSEGFTCRKICL